MSHPNPLYDPTDFPRKEEPSSKKQKKGRLAKGEEPSSVKGKVLRKMMKGKKVRGPAGMYN